METSGAAAAAVVLDLSPGAKCVLLSGSHLWIDDLRTNSCAWSVVDPLPMVRRIDHLEAIGVGLHQVIDDIYSFRLLPAKTVASLHA